MLANFSSSTAAMQAYAARPVNYYAHQSCSYTDSTPHIGKNTVISNCYDGLWMDHNYCTGDGNLCDHETDDGLVQLASGRLQDARCNNVKGGPQPAPTAATNSTTMVTPANSSSQATSPQASCSSSVGAKVGIGAGVGVPLAAAAAGAILWALRERRLRKRAETSQALYTSDIGGIAGSMK